MGWMAIDDHTTIYNLSTMAHTHIHTYIPEIESECNGHETGYNYG
jgi:hypothetical protein